MIGLRGPATEAGPFHVDERSRLLVLLSSGGPGDDPGPDRDALASESLSHEQSDELESMTTDGLVTSTIGGYPRAYVLTDEGWDAANDALRRLIGVRRFLGVLEDRYAVVRGRGRP